MGGLGSETNEWEVSRQTDFDQVFALDTVTTVPLRVSRCPCPRFRQAHICPQSDVRQL